MRFPLNIAYRGDRTYLQGGDMFDAVMKALTKSFEGYPEGSFRLTFRHFTHGAHTLELCETIPPPKYAKAPAELRFKTPERAWLGYLMPEDGPEPTRIPFEEQRIYDAAYVDDRVCKAPRITEFSPMIEFISLTKLLHNQLFPEANRRWIVCQIDLKTLPLTDLPSSRCKVHHLAMTPGYISRNAIYLDNKALGFLNFAGIPKT